MKFLSSLSENDLKSKTILLRCDLNVPVKNGIITDDTRIKHILPTIQYLRKYDCKIHLISHFGRPKGQIINDLSLEFLKPILSEYISEQVDFKTGSNIILHENLRFSPGEESNDFEFAKQLATLAAIYVNDAFSACHRAHASVSAITNFLPSYAGFGFEKEIKALEAIFLHPKKTVLALIGGAKISTKISILKQIIPKVDHLILGGAMANTFLKAKGFETGKSLIEPDHIDTALEIIEQSKKHACELHLPIDIISHESLDLDTQPSLFSIEGIPKNHMIFDIGPQTIKHYKSLLTTCKTILWNGPLGVFEKPPYDHGTNEIANIVAARTKSGQMTSVAGGGDTYSALNYANAAQDFSYVSCAGGAFLEWLEGKELPGIIALKL